MDGKRVDAKYCDPACAQRYKIRKRIAERNADRACDGCGEPVNDPVKVGHVVKRDYCVSCAAIANEFIDAEEVLRRDTQTRFIDERALLIVKYSAGLLKLPDLPT